MISILIPVYNVDVYSLVKELTEQLDSLDVNGEILVYDDGSSDLYTVQNRSVTTLSRVFYQELNENHGRIKIRQLLAKNTINSWLLFVDADSVIISKNYIKSYLEALNNDDVYVGGRVYQKEMPEDCSKRLHWKYGKMRESVRGRGGVFHTNNFCISKDTFLQLNFPEQLTGYGHEDTWMEIMLNRQQRKIRFIDNPIMHEGLEDSRLFLEKTKNALRNLMVLTNIFGERLIREKVRLYNLFYWQRKFGLDKLLSYVLHNRIKKMERHLCSCNPSLFQFDLYRLYYLMGTARKSFLEKLPGKN